MTTGYIYLSKFSAYINFQKNLSDVCRDNHKFKNPNAKNQEAWTIVSGHHR